MNIVEELKRLKDAHDERKKGCVAYAKDSKGNKIKNWKQKVITWESKESKKKKEFKYETI